MRVLMVTYRYPPDVGGVEAFAKNLSDALSGLGVSVTVIAGADTTSTSNEEGVEVHRFELSRGHARGARFAARVRAIAKRLPRHDLVHAHIASAPAVAAVLVAGRWRAPVVVKPSSGAQGGGNLAAVISRGGGRLRVGILRRKVDAFVAISPDIADGLERVWHVPRSRIVEIPNGVQLDRFAPAARPRVAVSPRRYLYVGRLWTKQKALDVLMKAWIKAGEPGTLTLVGDGPDRAALEAVAPPSVRFVGAVPDASEWYHNADVFVLPSRWEGLSNALLEAVAAGLPVIATDVGGTARVLGNAGRLVPTDDVGALADALAAAPPAAVDRATFDERYGLGAVARQHVELYERLIRERTG